MPVYVGSNSENVSFLDPKPPVATMIPVDTAVIAGNTGDVAAELLL